MERVAWTDERLDDLSRRMDAGFERVERDLRELRAGLDSLRAELHAEIDALRAATNRIGIGIIVTLIGVIAAVFVNGA